MEEFEVYEFNIQLWFEDGEWNYSVVQEFEFDNSNEVEALLYGTCDTLTEATHLLGDFVSELDFDS